MWDALVVKVAEVHRSCVGDRISNLSALQKVANIEKRLVTLLQDLENVDKESLEKMRKIKDSEKRSRYVSVTSFSCLHKVKLIDKCITALHAFPLSILFPGFKIKYKYFLDDLIVSQGARGEAERAGREAEGKDEEELGEIYG